MIQSLKISPSRVAPTLFAPPQKSVTTNISVTIEELHCIWVQTFELYIPFIEASGAEAESQIDQL
jgi:hypothetical protein